MTIDRKSQEMVKDKEEEEQEMLDERKYENETDHRHGSRGGRGEDDERNESNKGN